ncbi:MAG: hypothetical protein DKT66_16980 [Candidatus Melainabacteria bacterium]|nr:MAG: hypothetical protein DKT66_16980 [Candidatus Melainabacteria bacterium]
MTNQISQAALITVSLFFATQTACFALEKSAHANQKFNPLDAEETIFSGPANASEALPKYKMNSRPADEIRTFIQAGTPDLDQVRLIGSLKGKQREAVVKAYEKGRAELTPMNQEFNELRKKMPAKLIEKMLSKEESQMDMMTKSEEFELLLKARNMLQKLRSKRLSIWEEIQAKLSPAQLEELDKLKSGQLPEDLMQQTECGKR